MEKLIGTIMAEDAKGNQVKIMCYQEFIEATSMSDPSRQWLPGHKRYETASGVPVNELGERMFEVPGSGLELKQTEEMHLA